jgi:hypothetical protein
MKKTTTTMLTERIDTSETSVAFTTLHDDISRKIELFITTAMRTPDATNSVVFA